jgi:hypothetical protein
MSTEDDIAAIVNRYGAHNIALEELDALHLDEDNVYSDRHHSRGGDHKEGIAAISKKLFGDICLDTDQPDEGIGPLTSVDELPVCKLNPSYGSLVTFDNVHTEILRDNDVVHERRSIAYRNVSDEFKNIGVTVLFRLYMGNRVGYHYMVKHTYDILDEMEALNDEHSCNWEIEILTIQKSNSQDTEVSHRWVLLSIGHSIRHDSYDIDSGIFEHMKKTADYVNPFYSITDTDEMYMGKSMGLGMSHMRW